MSATFDPTKHLRQLRGKGGTADYLDVKYRLVWLRTEHPDAITAVEHVEISPDIAIFRATVSIPGRGSATDYGSETPRDFGDYIEKAATKALGRALAQLGFGTQFVGFELDENTRIVDSPVERKTQDDDGHMAAQPRPQSANQSAPQRRTPPAPSAPRPAVALTAAGPPQPEPPRGDEQGNQRATERQVKFIYAIAREAGLDEQELAAWSQELYAEEVDRLNRRDASTLIEALQRRRNEVA